MQLLFSIWKKINLYIQKGVSLILKGCGQKVFQEKTPPPAPITVSFFISDADLRPTRTGYYRPLTLVNSIVSKGFHKPSDPTPDYTLALATSLRKTNSTAYFDSVFLFQGYMLILCFYCKGNRFFFIQQLFNNLHIFRLLL